MGRALIESLRIENWVIVDEAELEFGPGLNVLTGETGTGKSIVLGALALLAGGRGSADAVRTGAPRASVEAIFRTEQLKDFESELARRGLLPDHSTGDAHELVLLAGVADRVGNQTAEELSSQTLEACVVVAAGRGR